MNKEKIKIYIKKILKELGENPEREGLVDTPNRVARMYEEIFKGYLEPLPKIVTFDNGQDGIVTKQLITDCGDFYSHCEHHMIPFFGNYYFGYIPSPKGKILGLSKVARIVDYHSSKLQIQERLVKNIVDDLWNALSKGGMEPPLAMGLVMRGEHMCKSMRGVKKKGSMVTSEFRGDLVENVQLRQEFFSLVNL